MERRVARENRLGRGMQVARTKRRRRGGRLADDTRDMRGYSQRRGGMK